MSTGNIWRPNAELLQAIEQSRRIQEQLELPPELVRAIEQMQQIVTSLPAIDPPMQMFLMTGNPPIVIDLTAKPPSDESAE